jgi:hypothetical protein
VSLLQQIESYRNDYGQYHHHKEVMAYGATVLYVTAAVWITFQPTNPLMAGGPGWLLPRLILLLVTAALTFAFIVWQLRQRRFAADMVAACTNLLARSIPGQPPSWPTDAVPYNGVQLPHVIVDELIGVEQQRGAFRGTGVSEWLTYIMLLASSALVAWRFYIG